METETSNVPVTIGEIWDKLTTDEKHFLSTFAPAANRGIIGLMTIDNTLAKMTRYPDNNGHCITCTIARKLRGLAKAA